MSVYAHPLVVGAAEPPAPGDAVPPSGPLPALVVRVSGEADAVERAGRGLPDGAATPEAVAVRARREGADVRWGEPDRSGDEAAFVGFCHARGRSSVGLVRADPSLAFETQIGTWFDADYRRRLLRRAALALPRLLGGRLLRAADDAFWAGVRQVASPAEWRRLTRSSYVVLLYHKLAGDGKRGQEKLDVAPERFLAHLRLLRRLRFHPLTADDVLAFHGGEPRRLPSRSYVLTLDDGTGDCAEPLPAAAWASPQLFVCTSEVGGQAHWLDGEPLLDWEQLAALSRAGIGIGAHARHHRRLRAANPAELADELRGSLADLRTRLPTLLPLVAYPHGANDEQVRRAAREAGFQAAYATEKGRNGLASDVYALRRVSVYGYDGRLALLWKASTGAGIPPSWERWRRRLRLTRREAPRPRPAASE